MGPVAPLRYMLDTGVLIHLEVAEAIVGTKVQKDVWLPESRVMGCIIIGKFTARSTNDGKMMMRRVVIDQAELDFLVHDLRATNSLVGYERAPGNWGHVLTYYEGSQPQFTHLRASMFGYVGINLCSMLQRFALEVQRVATDSLYLRPEVLCKLHGVGVYAKACTCPLDILAIMDELEGGEAVQAHCACGWSNPQWGQWRVKDEKIHAPTDSAMYLPKPEYWQQQRAIRSSASRRPPCHPPAVLSQGRRHQR